MKPYEINFNPSVKRALNEIGQIDYTEFEQNIETNIKKGNSLVVLGSLSERTYRIIIASIVNKLCFLKRKRIDTKCLIITKMSLYAYQLDKEVNEIIKYTGLKSTVLSDSKQRKESGGVKIQDAEIVTSTKQSLESVLRSNRFDCRNINMVVILNKTGDFFGDGGDSFLKSRKVYERELGGIMNCLPGLRQEIIVSDKKNRFLEDYILNGKRNYKTLKQGGIKTPNRPKTNHSVYFVKSDDKINLCRYLFKTRLLTCAIIYLKSSQEAKRLITELKAAKLAAVYVADQQNMNNTINDFNARKLNVLVSTDLSLDVHKIWRCYKTVVYNLSEPVKPYLKLVTTAENNEFTDKIIYLTDKSEMSAYNDLKKRINQNISTADDNPFKDDGEHGCFEAADNNLRYKDKNRFNHNVGASLKPAKTVKYKNFDEWFKDNVNKGKPTNKTDNKPKLTQTGQAGNNTVKDSDKQKHKRKNNTTQSKTEQILDFAKYNNLKRQRIKNEKGKPGV